MSDVEYLTLEDAFRMIRSLSIGPVRDVGLLDSALARPRSSAFGADAYASVGLKAAAMLHSLVSNHPLVDGNKRLAWLATVVFLRINDVDTAVTDDEAFALVWDIASGSVGLVEIRDRLQVD